MLLGINVVLLVLFELATPAMVLPRPPSSPNHIRQDQELSARKALDGKSLHGVSRDTNMERPDTEDYRYFMTRQRPVSSASRLLSCLPPSRAPMLTLICYSVDVAAIHFRPLRLRDSSEMIDILGVRFDRYHAITRSNVIQCRLPQR